MADFESWFDIRETEFHGPVYARVARFRRGIYGVGATFHEAADFLNTYFDDVENFYRATFEHGLVLDSSTFEGNAQFYEATLSSPAVKLESATGSPRSEGERRDGVALSTDGVTCERDLRLSDATLGGDVVFTNSDLGRDIECQDVTVADGTVVDCTGTSVVSGTVSGDDGHLSYDLTDAAVGEVTVEGDDSIDVFRFDGTTFAGFDFGRYKRELADREWRLHDDDRDGDPERRENLYLRAKNGAKDIGERRAAAEFFIQEMRYRRRGHRQRLGRADSPVDVLRSTGAWTANAALDLTCGYGERPLRPLTFSVALVVLFAGVFALLSPPLIYDGLLGYLVFSIEGFISVVLGLPEVTDTALGFVVAFEGFVGGFMIALFVFTLTRSISR